MRLIVEHHDGWNVKPLPPDRSQASRSDEPALTITYGPLVDANVSGHEWAKRVLAADLASDARPSVLSDVRVETVDGWPVALIRYDVVGSDGGIREARKTAIYSILQHASVAVARAPSPEILERHVEAVDRFFLAAKLDWQQPPCTIEAVLDTSRGREG